MEGETSNAEEQELYRFFSETKPLPEHLQQYTEMFAYFESGLDENLSAEALTKAEQTTANVVEFTHKAEAGKAAVKTVKHKHMLMYIAGIAASIMLIFGVSFSLLKNDSSDIYSCYEGSYMIHNGKQVTDKAQLRMEIDNTMQEAEDIENQVAQLSELSDKDENVSSMKSNICDKEAQARVNDFLNQD